MKVCKPEACSSRWLPPFFLPPNSRTLGTRSSSSSTHTRSFTLAPKILGLELLLGGGRSEERQRLGRAVAAPRDDPPPLPERGAARRAPQLRAGPPARPPATSGTNRRAARPLGGGNFWERGGVRCGRAGRRSGRRPRSPSGRGGAPRASVAGWGGPRAAARPLARATTIQRARRRAGTLNTRADKSFIFQSLTSLTRSPSAERSREDLGREPRVGRGGDEG